MKKIALIVALAGIITQMSESVQFQDEPNLALYRILYQSELSWEIFQARTMINQYLKEQFFAQNQESLEMEREAIRLRDPHGSHQAQVRLGHDIPREEKEALSERFQRVKKAIKRFAGLDYRLKDEEVPRIAICGSGGGIRAALCTLGSLIGALEIGLLDCTLYASALSGSAWLMGSIFSDSRSGHDQSVLHEYKHNMVRKLGGGLQISMSPISVKLSSENMLTKFYYGQRISLVDFWGLMVGEIMLQNLGQYWQKAVLSSQGMLMETGAYPFPLYTAIMPLGNSKFEWFEISPYEVWSELLGMGIPTWSFGRRFKNGVSVNYAPEQTLGYYLGVFGSAFELDLTDFMRHLGNAIKDPVLRGLITVLLKTSMRDLRISPAEFSNYSFGMKESVMPLKKRITLIDAGIDFNLPIPPLLRRVRDIDVIICLDGSTRVQEARELSAIKRYAKQHAIPLPSIDPTEAGQNTINVFKDNVDAPIIVYMPRAKNDNYNPDFDPDECANGGFCSTFNFEYNEEQALLLSGLTEANMKDSKEVLQEVVREAVNRKRAKLALVEERKK